MPLVGSAYSDVRGQASAAIDRGTRLRQHLRVLSFQTSARAELSETVQHYGSSRIIQFDL